MIAGNDCVGQGQLGYKATAKLTDEECRGRPVGSDIIRDGGVRNRDVAIGLEDRAAMPTSRRVAGDCGVGDGHVAQRPNRTTDITRGIAADGAARDGCGGLEE